MRAKMLIAAVLGVVIGLTGAVPAMAAASPGCGAVCEGKDPDTYIATVGDGAGRCGYSAWASTVKTAGGVELRYSSYCRTAWARATDPGYLGFVTVERFATATSTTVLKSYSTRHSGGAWTMMVNDKGYYARACHWQWDSEVEYNRGDPPYRTGCTGRY